jgi:transcriptional regulator of acetoin/glycerol metabolism
MTTCRIDIAHADQFRDATLSGNATLNKSKAAKRLGLTRTQLYVRLRKYSLE